jgi:hypothetical protein
MLLFGVFKPNSCKNSLISSVISLPIHLETNHDLWESLKQLYIISLFYSDGLGYRAKCQYTELASAIVESGSDIIRKLLKILFQSHSFKRK